MSNPNVMYKFLIKMLHQQDQIFLIERDEILIGRGEECQFKLLNVSVSRIHAKLEIMGDQVFLSDTASQNGFRVNGKKVETRIQLQSFDEIQIGTFSLVFLGNTPRDNFYRGRSVRYLNLYNPRTLAVSDDATFVMSKRDEISIATKAGLLNMGCVITKEGAFYYPESNILSFGNKKAIVSVEGWLVMGIVATIWWDNKRHILESESWWVPTRINGTRITKKILQPGDHFQIGKSSFQYKLREDDSVL